MFFLTNTFVFCITKVIETQKSNKSNSKIFIMRNKMIKTCVKYVIKHGCTLARIWMRISLLTLVKYMVLQCLTRKRKLFNFIVSRHLKRLINNTLNDLCSHTEINWSIKVYPKLDMEKYVHLLIFIQYIIRFSDILFSVYNPVISETDL